MSLFSAAILIGLFPSRSHRQVCIVELNKQACQRALLTVSQPMPEDSHTKANMTHAISGMAPEY